HAQLRALFPLALAQANAGDREASLRTLAEARTLAVRRADRFALCELHRTDLLVHYYVGRPRDAIEAGLLALEIAKEHNLFDEAASAARYLGESYLRIGDYRQAFAHLRYGYDLALEHKLGRIQFSCLCVLGFLDA